LVAEVAGPALPADALEGVDEVDAGAPVEAGIGPAVVDVLVAVHARVSRVADALASAAPAPARAGRPLAAAAEALVEEAQLGIVGRLLRAVLPLPLGGTVAVVVRLRIEALGEIPAGVGTAVVAVDLALVARVADGADALVGVDEVTALAAVLAGLGGALVDVDLAVLAGVAGRAGAVVVVHQVDAEGVVLALTDAVVDVAGAVLPCEAASALAPVGSNGHTR
jgi:hypothetical protein